MNFFCVRQVFAFLKLILANFFFQKTKFKEQYLEKFNNLEKGLRMGFGEVFCTLRTKVQIPKTSIFFFLEFMTII